MTSTFKIVSAAAFAFLSGGLPAEAQTTYGPRTVLGDFYQQTSNFQSIDGINAAPCNTTAICRVMFQNVPQDRDLIIQHVSCHINPGASGTVTWATLESRKGQNQFPYRITNFFAANAGNSNINTPVMHLVPARERPVITLHRNATGTFGLTQCSISGQLVPTP